MKGKQLSTYVLFFAWAVFASADQPPNIVVIFVDDLGYGDLSSYGSPTIATPNLDRMADEGLRATQFYVASPVCSASRASILTGRYPDRHGTAGVYFPGAKGLDTNEITIPEYLKKADYTTACIGKWHLGDRDESLPPSHGFDVYFGIPYSNDMWMAPHHKIADSAVFTHGYNREQALADQAFIREVDGDRTAIQERGIKEFPPLMRGTEVIEYPADQTTLTQRYFDEAIEFLESNQDQSCFIFLTPAMPHVPLFATEAFFGSSKAGLYGDTVEEIDANVGRLLDFLDDSKLSSNTLVIFTSDNGPWLGKGTHAGSSGPFRDGKFSVYEGGVRVPAIFRYPSKIPAGTTTRETIVSTDLLPTILSLVNLPAEESNFDGIDLSDHLSMPDTQLERPPHFFNKNGETVGVRVGDWKYLPHGGDRFLTDGHPAELYHLGEDPAERFNLAATYPEKVATLQALIDERIRSVSTDPSL